jgi:hypothetical protein
VCSSADEASSPLTLGGNPLLTLRATLPLLSNSRPHLPRVFRRSKVRQRFRHERTTHQKVIVSFAGPRTYCRHAVPCQPQRRSCVIRTLRWCLIRPVHLEPATVHHGQQLVREVALRWPREAKRYNTLLSETSRQSCGEAFTKPCAVNLEAHLAFPADHGTSRVRGQAVRTERARRVGKASLSVAASPHTVPSTSRSSSTLP